MTSLKGGRRPKAVLWTLLAVLLAVSSLGACNTLRGAGQDVENVGETVQDAFD
jgi:predicted small secreted protein